MYYVKEKSWLISRDVEKAPIIIKYLLRGGCGETSQQTRTEGNFLDVIKGIYRNLQITSYLIVKDNIHPAMTGNEVWVLTHSHHFQSPSYWMEVPTGAVM